MSEPCPYTAEGARSERRGAWLNMPFPGKPLAESAIDMPGVLRTLPPSYECGDHTSEALFVLG
ncbi:MAG: hypothetical protein JOY96_00130 [Verrucomicrobia bacterium]|nr:hypothetical protein [Verrucomicrobiota bacterium]